MSFEEDLKRQAERCNPYKLVFFIHSPFELDKSIHLDFLVKYDYYDKDTTSEPFTFMGLSFSKTPKLVDIISAAKAKHPDVPILRRLLQKLSKVSVAINERK